MNNLESHTAPLTEEAVTAADLMWLRHYFARPIFEPAAVLGRNFQKLPVVLRLLSVNSRGPCPTLFWLTEPDLVRQVSTLEAQGAIKLFQQRLSENTAALTTLEQQHQRYNSLRIAYLTDEHKALLNQYSITKPDQLGGIGGLKDPLNIKCLHLHLAHYLATKDNILGEWVLSEL